MKVMELTSRRMAVRWCLTGGLGLCWFWLAAFSAVAQDYIPATKALDSPGCSDVDLGGIDALGLVNIPSPQRANPEWKAIILDSTMPPYLQPPQILEGFVLPTPNCETSRDQAPAEVAESAGIESWGRQVGLP